MDLPYYISTTYLNSYTLPIALCCQYSMLHGGSWLWSPQRITQRGSTHQFRKNKQFGKINSEVFLILSFWVCFHGDWSLNLIRSSHGNDATPKFASVCFFRMCKGAVLTGIRCSVVGLSAFKAVHQKSGPVGHTKNI